MGRTARFSAIFLVLFLVCFGIGYPSLARFDAPATGGLSDTVHYHTLVTDSPAEAEGHWRFRVLVPYLAKPVYQIARGRTGSWDAVAFALLVVNSLLCSAAAMILIHLVSKDSGDLGVAMVAGLLLLLNFTVANAQLSGLVDAGEMFFLLVMVWILHTRRWGLLLPVFVLGALAKETFVPLAALMAGAWAASERIDWKARFTWLAASAVAGLVTVCALQSGVTGSVVLPWDITERERSSASFLFGLSGCILDRNFFYVFIWILPLGLTRLQRVPIPWVAAGVTGALGALALGSYHASGGNVARAMYHCVGPVLCYSAAIWLTERKKMGVRAEDPPAPLIRSKIRPEP